MGFLTDDPDLNGWIYTLEDFARAREFLVQLITTIAPGWLDTPRGRLGTMWKQGGSVSVCYVIDVARTLHVARRAATSNSMRVFETKVRQLLNARDNDQYEEILTELQFAAALSEHVSPIAFEPLVPTEQSGGPRQPFSPDYGVLLPEGELLLEVTVARFEFLREWHAAVRELSRRITHRIGKASAKLSFRLDFPIGFRVAQISETQMRELLRRIEREDHGQHQYPVKDGGGTVSWSPLVSTYTRPGEEATVSKISISWPTFRLVVTRSLDVETLTSFRNTVKKKARRWNVEAPYVLVVKPGDPWITWQTLADLTEAHIWAKQDYRRLSGILVFSPRRNFETSAPPTHMHLTTNPDPAHPMSPSFLSVFELGHGFHYDSASGKWRDRRAS